MFRKEIYLPFILSISLFLIIDYSSYNHIVLGKEDDSNDRDDKDNNVKEEEKGEEENNDNRDDKDNNVKEEEKEEEDFEDASLDELFDDNDHNDNRDDKDNNVKEEEKEEDGKEEEDEVPFLLPFTAVPFP